MLKILIVDDHPIFRDGLAQTLKGMSPRPLVIKAGSVVEARDALRATEALDLVIVDLRMPEESGLDLLAYMDRQNRVEPVLAMSGETDLALVQRALSLGAMGFVSKTSPPDDILKAISTTLAGEYFLSDQIKRDLDELQDHGVPAVAREIGITQKQFAVLELMADGLSNRDIAAQLSLTEHTVKSHSQALFSALSVSNRTACVARAQALGLIHATRRLADGSVDSHS